MLSEAMLVRLLADMRHGVEKQRRYRRWREEQAWARTMRLFQKCGYDVMAFETGAAS